ncbi:MAG: MutL protein [Alphaproteobacteria bacterium]|nr:MutL protein [Alphaproteobacteria bacterium]
MSATRGAALLIDFGSTYTKLRAIDLDDGHLLGHGQGPSTVTTDVTIGVDLALADLGRRLGELPAFRYRLAASSAAGGLRMVTVGLVKELTAEAARRAALGAGAKLVGTFAYRLTRADVGAICGLAPDILLLAGGTDGGNAEVITANGRALAASPLGCPVVVAGNRAAADAVQAAFAAAGKPVMVCGNVMPEFGVLDIEPARAAIRQVFIDRIVHAKGIDKAQGRFDRVLMPTPTAVLEGARLLAEGRGGLAGLGPLLVVDIGGATTDVHSICDGRPSAPEVVVHGLPEPYAKRTVEGDLGMRHNIQGIVEVAGLERLARESGLEPERIRALAERFARDVERVPETAAEVAFDRALARAAIEVAVRRHAGEVKTVFSATGPVLVQTGKDLSDLPCVIGTGGALVHSPNPAGILAAALASADEPGSLRPRAPRLYLDREYLLYAVGLLAEVEPEAALNMALRHITLL